MIENKVDITNEFFNAVINTFSDGVVITDERGVINLVNSEFEQLTGYSKSEALGKDLIDFMPLMSENGKLITRAQRAVSIILNKKAEKLSINQNLQTNYYLKKDKSKYPVSGFVAPLTVDKKLVGVIQIFRDGSREKDVEKLKYDFLSIAAHQLRTPLGSMRWNIEILLREYLGSLDDLVKDTINQIYRSNQQAMDLVNELLDVSRIDQERVLDQPILISIQDVIKNSIEEMKPDADRSSIKIFFEQKSENIPKIIIDPDRFKHVIQNLLSNSIKYNKQNGTVTIELEVKDNNIIINIIDTGIGIPEKSKQKLFSKFFRGENAIKSAVLGTGLGLYVVKSYVNSWGGEVSVSSRENLGSTFTLSLPIKPNQHVLDKNLPTNPYYKHESLK